ncbi:MAG: thiamine pyrophosphate-dependent enzyme [Waddliaceae bacterium]
MMEKSIQSQPTTTTIGQYLLDELQKNGVNHIFGLPGDYVLRFNQLIEQHSIQFINTTRENTAGYMADAYARLRGLGVVCITYGVGINVINAIAQAYMESSPLIVISGAAGTAEFRRSSHLHHTFAQRNDRQRDTIQLEMLAKVTVAQTVLDDPGKAAKEIHRVILECLCRKKPVYIEIPRDQVDTTIPSSTPAFHPCKNSHPQIKEALNEVQDILRCCNRPVIWVGHEIHRYRLAESVIQFAEKHCIPMVSSLLGKTAISEYHPLYLGVYQGKMSVDSLRHYVESCDCLFLLGVVLSDVNTGLFTANLTQEHKIEATADSILVCGHRFADIFLTDFVRELGNLDLDLQFRSDFPSRFDKRVAPYSAKKGKKITAEGLFVCLQHFLRPEHLVVSDVGDCLFGSAELTLNQDSYLSNAYFASLGFGVPAAIGAQLASPDKRVVAVVGDGAFQMTGMELSTAIRYDADPIIILLNNHGFATEKPLMEGEFNEIVNWNYSKLPHVLNGGIGVHVHTENGLKKALMQAFSTRGVYFLIEVELNEKDMTPGLRRFCDLIKAMRA